MLSRIRTTVAILCALCAALWVSATAGAVAAETGALTLRDQYGNLGGLADDAGGLQVAIVVSAKRLRRIKPWEQAIRTIDAEVPVIRVADVPRTPPAEYQSVADKLKKRLPEDLNVLIDLDGIWTQTFGLDTSVPNVLIFDAGGTLRARHAGMYRNDQFDALAADLTGAPTQDAPPAQSP